MQALVAQVRAALDDDDLDRAEAILEQVTARFGTRPETEWIATEINHEAVCGFLRQLEIARGLIALLHGHPSLPIS
jgi:hypothetical protein